MIAEAIPSADVKDLLTAHSTPPHDELNQVRECGSAANGISEVGQR